MRLNRKGSLAGQLKGHSKAARRQVPSVQRLAVQLAVLPAASLVSLEFDQRPRFRDYVIREHRSVYRLREPVTVGTVLPPEGVTFYAIPREFGVPPSYRYAVVNDEVVLVDPVTREIVDVVD